MNVKDCDLQNLHGLELLSCDESIRGCPSPQIHCHHSLRGRKKDPFYGVSGVLNVASLQTACFLIAPFWDEGLV